MTHIFSCLVCLLNVKRKYYIFRTVNLGDMSFLFLVASIMFCVTVLLSALLFIRQISALYE